MRKVTVWSIDQCSHPYEAECRDSMMRQLIERFGALEGSLPFDIELVFGLHLPGAELDLVAFLPHCVIIGDLKEIYGTLRGEMNGTWYVEKQKRIQPLKRRENTWEQVRRYRALVIREIRAFEARSASRVFKTERPHDICRSGLVQVPALDLESSINDPWWYACGHRNWIPYIFQQDGGDNIDMDGVRDWLRSIGCEKTTLEDAVDLLGIQTHSVDGKALSGESDSSNTQGLPTNLDDSQRSAVTHSGERPLVIMAGPGSGKTSVVVERAKLLSGRMTERGWMAVVSYTNGAADEIRARMKGETDGESLSAETFVGTFHSFALEVLKRSRISKVPRALIDDNSARWRYACCCGISEEEARSELRIVTGCSISEVAEEVRRNWSLFLNHLRSHEVATFQSLLHDLLEIVDKDPDALPEFLIYDEFQDVSPVQGELIRKLAQKGVRISVVGDPEQSIFGFNGCSPDSLISFAERSSPGDVKRLGVNYRSHHEIVGLTKLFRLTPGVDLEISSGRKLEAGGWEALRFGSDREQMKFVAEWAAELNRAEGVVLDEIAILFRGWKSLGKMAAALDALSIPYHCDRNEEGTSRPLRELVSILQLSSRLDDPETLFEVLENLPKVSKGFVRELLELEREKEALTLDALGKRKEELSSAKRGEAEEVLELVERIRAKRHPSAEEELEWLWNEIVKPRMSLEESRRAHRFEETVEIWRDYIRLRPAATGKELRDALSVMGEEPADESAVHLGTIHSAKGKEWFCVAVIDVCDETFLKYAQDPTEEIRLLHVAFSRAISRLLVCLPERRGLTPDQGKIRNKIENIVGKTFVSAKPAELKE